MTFRRIFTSDEKKIMCVREREYTHLCLSCTREKSLNECVYIFQVKEEDDDEE